jgi:Leucine-rich repeat (LRR) protein
MKIYLYLIISITLISCKNDSDSSIRSQINEQKEEGRVFYRIELDDFELQESSFDILKVLPISELSISNNKIDKVPTGIFKLNNLKHLSIQRNPKISTLDKSISNLHNLERLWIIGSHIESLPNNVFELQKLKQLILDNNKLTTISDSIKNLSNLEFLDLGNNNLRNIPISITGLKSLSVLYLNGNPNIEIE